MSTVVKRWTYDDLAAMPEDNVIREILDGELFVAPSPVTKHQRVVRRLLLAIGSYLEQHPIGEVFIAPFDTVFAIDNVCSPDVLFVSNERSSIITKKNIQGAPDFVVEVLSKFNRRNDEISKRAIYERFGVDEYWIVDPEADTVRVHRRQGKALVLVSELAASANDNVTTPIFPGLTIDVATLFR
jgi:Uma2 family endonuclease